MKGLLSFCGKLMFLRTASIPILFIVLNFSTAQAKSVLIGSGSGFVSVQNMNGLNPGDVLTIAAGNYTGGSFSNLRGITITNNGGPVIFNGTVTLNTLVECQFSGFQFKNVAGIGIRWDGNSRRCVEKQIAFYNVQGDANNASEHNLYNGDTSSLKMYLCTFDSLTLFRSGLLMMASWGGAASDICYMDSMIFSHIKIDSTLSNGTEIRGTFFRMDAHDWKVTYKGTNNVLGDVGLFYIVGNGYFHNIYRNGGRGYMMRIWNTGLKTGNNNTGTYFYNNIDLNSSVYGTVDTRIEGAETQFTTGGNCYIYNNTAGNKDDNIGYWSSIAVVGQYPKPYSCQVRNNLGFNLKTNGKPPITMNQSSDTWEPDSSNNLYFDKPDGVLDPVTGTPVVNSPVLGKGISVSWIPDDHYHNPRTGAYDVGAVQHGGAPIAVSNQGPVANAGSNQTITAPANSITLNGKNSFDPDGHLTGFHWTQVSGPAAAPITSDSIVDPFVSGLMTGQYVFELTVTDDSSATDKDQVTIIVRAPAAAPAPPASPAVPPPSSAPVVPVAPVTPAAPAPPAAPAAPADSPVVNKVPEDSDQLVLYPNPAHDIITGKIISKSNGTTLINMYDMHGQWILSSHFEKTGETQEEKFNISRLAAGVYIIQVKISNRKPLVARFLKN